MPRKRDIRSEDAEIWLGVLLDSAFDPTSRTLNLSRSAEILNDCSRQHGMTNALKLTARDGKSQLLALASDFTNYPGDFTYQRRAELLLEWVNRWLQPEDWQRLRERVKKRRQDSGKNSR